ncbi:hypothetical protein ABIF65_009013 [Bradyrhizobium japonicum]|nr:hypothetical protein [Bradyrhizobium japonicum]MCP1774569.1 hypothetical protein [Bradyrhizobium japonicum]MCP1865816.1 hypothetical protein [Bradyrhizobium japonicum]MCP1895413.1 hypothetical protein [Bradyrhizobium japonicum]MCP1962429.1 hypothetical protein [Bradyrhizobium japonicum]
MYTGGTYKTDRNVLVVSGTDGHGGPPSDVVSRCKFALIFKGNELILRDCAFEGDWRRVCRTLQPTEDGSLACLRNPAN